MVLVSSSRRSVSQGAEQKIARENIKNTRREEAKERLWANLTKDRSDIPGSGISSDWSILIDFGNSRAFLTQDNLVLSTDWVDNGNWPP